MHSAKIKADVIEIMAELLHKQINWRLQQLHHAWRTNTVGTFIKKHQASKYACLPRGSKKQLRRDAQYLLDTLSDLGLINDR